MSIPCPENGERLVPRIDFYARCAATNEPDDPRNVASLGFTDVAESC